MQESTFAEERLIEVVMIRLPNYRPGWSESDDAAQQSRQPLWARAGENAAMAGSCIVGACMIAAAIPSPPHLPVSLTPFYLGVASAITLGAFLGRRNTGWYAFAFALPAIYLDASVAALVWIALTVATFAMIASIGSRENLRSQGTPNPPQNPFNQRKRRLIVTHLMARGGALS